MTWQPDLPLGETHTRPNQAERILAYLRTGARLTPLEALDRFGCFRLGARIWELKQRGAAISCRLVETAGGKRVAEYSL
jgi:hypothetical protein